MPVFQWKRNKHQRPPRLTEFSRALEILYPPAVILYRGNWYFAVNHAITRARAVLIISLIIFKLAGIPRGMERALEQTCSLA